MERFCRSLIRNAWKRLKLTVSGVGLIWVKESFVWKGSWYIQLKIRKIHERDYSKIKIDLAKANNNIMQNLEPYKNELSDTLTYRVNIDKYLRNQYSTNKMSSWRLIMIKRMKYWVALKKNLKKYHLPKRI